MDTIPELAKQVEFGGYDVLKVTGIAHAVWPCPCCAKACRFLCARRDRASQKRKVRRKERERESCLLAMLPGASRCQSWNVGKQSYRWACFLGLLRERGERETQRSNEYPAGEHMWPQVVIIRASLLSYVTRGKFLWGPMRPGGLNRSQSPMEEGTEREREIERWRERERERGGNPLLHGRALAARGPRE